MESFLVLTLTVFCAAAAWTNVNLVNGAAYRVKKKKKKNVSFMQC